MVDVPLAKSPLPLAELAGADTATDGQVPTSDGAGGVAWETPAGGGGGGGMVSLGTVTLGSDTATIAFSSIPGTYATLLLTGMVRSDRASNTTDVGSITINSDTTAGNYDRTVVADGGAITTTTSDRGLLLVNGATATAGQFTAVDIKIPGYASTAFRKVAQALITQWHTGGSTSGVALAHRSVLWKSTAAITDISFAPVNGTNWVTGSTMTLWGLASA